jgi:hypothetical protein
VGSMPEPSTVCHRGALNASDRAYAGCVSRSKRARGRSRRDAKRHVPSSPSRRSSGGRKPYLIADIPPLDVDGVATVAIGTAAWALTFVALLPFYGALQDHGRVWLLWTCLAGFGGGLLGLEYCRRRRNYLNADPSRERESSPFGAAGL